MNWKRFLAVAVALLAALSIGSGRLAAQTTTTGDITGVVTDPSGSIVPSATVTLKDETKGVTQESTTNAQGTYRFYLLTPGPYTISVTSAGFQTTSRRVDVAVGQVQTVGFQLTLGASSSSVVVTEAAPLLQTDNGDTSTTLNQQQIANVPNPGNDLTYIAQLAPGTVMNTMGGYGNVEAFGLPATSNLFTMNGMDDNDPFLNLNNSGASNLLLGSNEIQEADVVTNGFSGAYGSFGGMNVNYVTKSGGNDFHGNAVYYWTGRAMDANDWFDKAEGNGRPFNNANQWAASFGGPIKKDKLFFFINQEGLRVLIPVPSEVTVPNTAFEAATVQNLQSLGLTSSIPFYCQNLAGICPGVGPVAGAGAGIFNLYNAIPNYANATPLTSALTNSPCGGNQQGVGNPIPIASLPNQTCLGSVLETPINFAPEWQIAGRFDWNIGSNDRAFVRIQYDHGIQPTATDPISPAFNITSDQPEWQSQINETHTFSPTLVNQLIIAGTWYSSIFQSPDEAAKLAAFPGTLQFGDGSLTNIGGAIGYLFPQGRNVTQFQVGDDVSKTLGNHTVKFGFKFHRNWVSDHDGGFFTTPLEVPLSLTDFFNGGSGANMTQAFSSVPNIPIRINNLGFYVQDEWRIKPNFSVTAALRLEHNSNPYCTTDCFSTFAGGYDQALANEGDPYNTLIQTGRSQALYNLQGVVWQPRVSFAWQPFGAAGSGLRSNFVVRGGFGIFNDIFPGTISDNMSENPPLYNQFVVAGTAPLVGGTCNPGYLSPNQPGNLFDCETAANTAFQTAYASGANAVAANPNIVTATHRIDQPQYQKWNLQIQKGFGQNTSFSIEYDGNHGIHEPIVNTGLNAFGFGSLPAVVPQAQFSEITLVESEGISNYNGLTMSFQRRFGASGLLQVNYTWSHNLDEVSNGGFLAFTGQNLSPQDPYNLRNNYGPSDYDIRHNVNANYVWQVPIRKALGGHGWGPLVDGWQVSGTAFYRTGLPYTITDGAISADLASNNYFAAVRPDALVSGLPSGCASRSSAFTNPSVTPCYTASIGGTTPATACNIVTAGDFPIPGCETALGMSGTRNKYRGPQYVNTDFTIFKNTTIPHWERGKLGIGFQFFNLFNHPNFGPPVSDISNSLFGQTDSLVSPPTSILGSFLGGDASPRLIQLKATVSF
jgi:Carboxypeptidase regulatory-like domain/TonB dependent receptor